MGRSRFELPPRLVDWSVFGVVVFAALTGLVSLVTGRPGQALVFVAHGVGGLALVVVLFWKLKRVRHRITNLRAWDRATPISILLATLALVALGTGIYWAFGGHPSVGPWTLLFVHMALGALVVPFALWHLRHRWRAPKKRDFEGRRTAMGYLVVVGFGALAWRFQQGANRILGLAGATHRFTGSREEGSDAGNGFPVTMWAADDPGPVDPDDWKLEVGGSVAHHRTFDASDLDSDTEGRAGLDADGQRRAVLDCTSGWYADHDWRGVRVGDLLDAAEPADDARWIAFRSVTGYQWSLPIEEARDALLATHVDGDRLSHGHGFPLRLVAPGRRGFQWVKWVESVNVSRHRDLSELVAIFTSGFEE